MAATIYRRRVTTIRAIQWTGSNLAEIHAEFGTAGISLRCTPDAMLLQLVTIQGQTVLCTRGEWVAAERVPGRFYSIADDVFADSYDTVPAAGAAARPLDQYDARVLNAVAGALTSARGFIPLDVRYRAAAAALDTVAEWEQQPPTVVEGQRGVCPGCSNEYALNGDGTVRKHDVQDGKRMRPCQGSHRPPKGRIPR